MKELKLNLFAPVDKIPNIVDYSYETEVYNDDSYRILVQGVRLTQIHRDILDIALNCGSSELEQMTDTTVPVRTFSLYMVLSKLNHKNKRNFKWLRTKFTELKRANIVVYDKKEKETYEFNIIRISKHSDKLNTFVIVLEELYMALFEKEISVDYKALLPEILKLKHPQTKAIIRYLLTHTKGHQINIDKLMSKVGIGFNGNKRNFEIYRSKILKELEDIKDIFNLELIKMSNDKRKKSDYTIKYKRHEDIKIYYP